jgi:hypothetical protein
MLNTNICRIYRDYYLFGTRSISWEEELAFSASQIYDPITILEKYSFTSEHQEIETLGFLSSNSEGKWSNGNIVKIAFLPPSSKIDLIVSLSVRPYVGEKNPKVSVKVYVNGRHATDWVFEHGKAYPETKLGIFRTYGNNNSKVEITFIIEGAASPQSLGYENIPQKLGLLFNSLVILPDINRTYTPQFYDY